MSSSRTRGQQLVHVRSKSGPIEITLLNHRIETVGTGFGELRRRVDPGIYKLRFETGIDEDERFITVQAGKDYVDLEVELPILSAAPLVGTTGFDKKQCIALSRLSREPRKTVDKGGRLMLFIRNPNKHRSENISLSQLEVRDSEKRAVCIPDDDAERNKEEGWACCSLDVRPGGYSLRWHNKWHSLWATSAEPSDYVDQSLWVQPGWITALFLVTNPRRDYQPRMTGMTVHMRRMSVGFVEPGDKRWARINQVSQLALNSLISGQAFVPTDIVDLMADEKNCNPMVGILGGHALLQENTPRWSYFDAVVRRISKLIPNHPDSVALRLLGKLRREDKSRTRSENVVWPPMVHAGYRGLVERDWAEGGLVEPQSKAEAAASRLLGQGPWTVWASAEGALKETDAKTPRRLPKSSQVAKILEEVEENLRPGTRSAITDTREHGAVESLSEETDPATFQVADFLEQLQNQKSRPDPKIIARQISNVGLPMSSVVRALNSIKGFKA